MITDIRRKEKQLPDTGLQTIATFPDWKGYVDNTLALNCTCGFFGYHGQGRLYIVTHEKIESFRLYVNGRSIDTGELCQEGVRIVDISSFTIDGMNSVQISNIRPTQIHKAITVGIPYPEILPGTPEEEGVSQQALLLMSKLIETDIENGFTSAQLSIIRNGRLIYENAWGKNRTYLVNGRLCLDSPPVTTNTLYDLASVTKMFSVNYAMQKLVTDEKVDLDGKIVDYLGAEFVTETEILPYKYLFANKEVQQFVPDIETIKKWKADLTIRDLLRHQGGFPADPEYSSPVLYRNNLPGKELLVNPLFAGNAPGAETKLFTIKMICRTPLIYEPGTRTVYSDVDYMILGLVVEKITGETLDRWLKKHFFEPMNLSHITYNPLNNGFVPEDCAVSELNGNTRDGARSITGYRTDTIQGEVHDEKAYYCFSGISGHAGLFSNATDLAKLASVMLCGGYGNYRFFSRNVLDTFTAPKEVNAANWGLGWWRQGDLQRSSFFGTQTASDTIGHQGWTGTMVMIDQRRNLVLVFLTNKISSFVTDKNKDVNMFDGNWYTTASLGVMPQLLYVGLDSNQDVSNQLLDLAAEMVMESYKLIPEGVSQTGTHPAVRNARSKMQLFEKMADEFEDDSNKDRIMELRNEIRCFYI